VTQLRTGHAPLNAHFHRIGKAESSECPAFRHHKEDVAHDLLQCPAYHNYRERLRRGLQRTHRGLHLSHILTEPKSIPHLIQYVADAQRFAANFTAVQLPRPHLASCDPLQDAML
ncbi:hypothetical protein BDZ89DRAFT_958487, partial [Hymenopellis radicata]